MVVAAFNLWEQWSQTEARGTREGLSEGLSTLYTPLFCSLYFIPPRCYCSLHFIPLFFARYTSFPLDAFALYTLYPLDVFFISTLYTPWSFCFYTFYTLAFFFWTESVKRDWSNWPKTFIQMAATWAWVKMEGLLQGLFSKRILLEDSAKKTRSRNS